MITSSFKAVFVLFFLGDIVAQAVGYVQYLLFITGYRIRLYQLFISSIIWAVSTMV